jgi:hypothetical protein
MSAITIDNYAITVASTGVCEKLYNFQFIQYMDVTSVLVVGIISGTSRPGDPRFCPVYGSVSQRKMAEDMEVDSDISLRKQVIQAQMGKPMVKGQTW